MDTRSSFDLRQCVMVLFFAYISLSGDVLAQDASFARLEPYLSGGHSSNNIFAISDDGSTLVGFSGARAVKWSLDGTVSPVGEVSPAYSDMATDVSSDGSVIIGIRRDLRPWDDWLFRWTEQTGSVVIGPVERGSGPFVSSDGTIILGNACRTARQDRPCDVTGAFIWSADSAEIRDLGLFEGDWMDAYGLSGDGSTAVGAVDPTGPARRFAVRWTEEEGISRIGIPEGYNRSYATAVSFDGSVVLVQASKEGWSTADPFLWTAQDGFERVAPERSMTARSVARSLSSDGTTVVGSTVVPFVSGAPAIWGEPHGLRSIATLLEGAGIDLSAWSSLWANLVSGDGRIVAGEGTLYPSPVAELWVAVLPSDALQAGDADQDLDFDQLDLVRVLQSAKYLTGEAATWGEGDWNGAPGGNRGEPPAGDGLFNQLDIVTALESGTYLAGSYTAIAPNGTLGDEHVSIVYNARTGEVAIDAPTSQELTSINIDSADGIFTGDPPLGIGGSIDPGPSDHNIFKATFRATFGDHSFGHVAQTGLTQEFVANDLTVIGSFVGPVPFDDVDLVYIPVPEPTALVLLCVGLSALGAMRRQRWPT